MIRRPPRSTLFPYNDALPIYRRPRPHRRLDRHGAARARLADLVSRPARLARRSEEHTSELQSRPHLVCRLLLEKKKKSKTSKITKTKSIKLVANITPQALHIQ